LGGADAHQLAADGLYFAPLVWVLLNNRSGNSLSSFWAPFVTFSAFDQVIQSYFDSSQVIEVQVNLASWRKVPNPADSISEAVTLTDMSSRNAPPCATMAH
jgi:hypothetical protein